MFINTTPHDIHIYKDDKIIYTFKKSTEYECRLDIEEQRELDSIKIDDVIIPLFSSQKYVALSFLKNGKDVDFDDKYKYIVSIVVKDYINNNFPSLTKNFYVVDSNKGAVRKNGQIIGTTRLLR